MKFIGICFILLGSTMSGFVIDAWEKKRIKELENFVYIFEIIKRDIDYQLSPLKEACESSIHFGRREIANVFKVFVGYLEEKQSWDVAEMWQKALSSQKNSLYLKGEDYEHLERFGKACGYLDKEMQEKNIEMVIEALKISVIEAQRHYEKTTIVNKYIGFFIGACISIFLI